MSSNAKENEAQKGTIQEVFVCVCMYICLFVCDGKWLSIHYSRFMQDRETVLEYYRELKAEMVKSRELER